MDRAGDPACPIVQRHEGPSHGDLRVMDTSGGLGTAPDDGRDGVAVAGVRRAGRGVCDLRGVEGRDECERVALSGGISRVRMLNTATNRDDGEYKLKRC